MASCPDLILLNDVLGLWASCSYARPYIYSGLVIICLYARLYAGIDALGLVASCLYARSYAGIVLICAALWSCAGIDVVGVVVSCSYAGPCSIMLVLIRSTLWRHVYSISDLMLVMM